MVGLRSGGTSLLFPWVGGWVGGSALPCHPDRSNPILSSHLTSREMDGLRSGGTSPLFSFREGCPRLGLEAGVLGLPVPFGIPPRPRPRNGPNRSPQRQHLTSCASCASLYNRDEMVGLYSRGTFIVKYYLYWIYVEYMNSLKQGGE